MSYNDPDDDDSIAGSTRRPLSRREFPDEEDARASLDDTDPCPHCGAPIYVDGEWCPKCGKYLSKEDSPSTIPGWAVAVAAILVIVFVVFSIFGR